MVLINHAYLFNVQYRKYLLCFYFPAYSVIIESATAFSSVSA